MNENLKRLELILKQDISESIFIIESEGAIVDCSDLTGAIDLDKIVLVGGRGAIVDCSDFTGAIDLDKIISDNFDDGEFLTNVTFVLGDNIELIAEYQHINVIFGSECQIYVDTENEFGHETKGIEITGKDNNVVKVGKNVTIKMNNNNEIYSGDNCKITVENDNFIEIVEDFGKIYLEGTVEIAGKKNNRIILPPINNNGNNIKVGKNSNIFIKGYDISFE